MPDFLPVSMQNFLHSGKSELRAQIKIREHNYRRPYASACGHLLCKWECIFRKRGTDCGSPI